MKKLLLIFIVFLLTSCLGSDYDYSETTSGIAIHNSVTTTNIIAFDPLNIAIRFSLLMQEAKGWDNIETATATIDEEEEVLIREVLFGSSEYCTIEIFEEPDALGYTIYAISYLESFDLDDDDTRLGTFFIKANTETLFNDYADWKIYPALGTETKDDNTYVRPYIIASTFNAYYGSSKSSDTYLTIAGAADGALSVEGVSRADLTTTYSSNVAANWKIEYMDVDFSSDYSFIDRSKSIYISYGCSGQLLNNFEGYTVEQNASTLTYTPECYKRKYVDGIVTTYNPYYIDGLDYTKTTVEVDVQYNKNCSYITYVTYGGYTDMW